MFVGDLARGRTVRSLATTLTLFKDVKQYFVAPESLQIGKDIVAQLEEAGMAYEITEDFERILPEVDAVYMTRIQDEWDKGEESRAIDTTPFHITEENVNLLKKDAIIMHPLPRRAEIAVESGQRSSRHVLASGAKRYVDSRRLDACCV